METWKASILELWLDTLCCPMPPSEAKALALAQMRRTYESSRRVLLVDAGLKSYRRHEITCVEALGPSVFIRMDEQTVDATGSQAGPHIVGSVQRRIS